MPTIPAGGVAYSRLMRNFPVSDVRSIVFEMQDGNTLRLDNVFVREASMEYGVLKSGKTLLMTVFIPDETLYREADRQIRSSFSNPVGPRDEEPAAKPVKPAEPTQFDLIELD